MPRYRPEGGDNFSVITLELILLFVVGENAGELQHNKVCFLSWQPQDLFALETCLDMRYQHGLQQQ